MQLPEPLSTDRPAPVFDDAASRALADAYLLILDVRRRRLAASATPTPASNESDTA
jgi:hypothetical protein